MFCRSNPKFLRAGTNCAAVSMRLAGLRRNSSPDDRSQGVQLAATQELAATGRPRRLAPVRGARTRTTVQDRDLRLDIDFIHVKSAHENASPLIMTTAGRSTIIELLETIGPRTDPTAHGGREEDVFHLVLLSIPGYGFSDEPTNPLGPIFASGTPGRSHAAPRSPARRAGRRGGFQVTDAMGRLALDEVRTASTRTSLCWRWANPEAERVATLERRNGRPPRDQLAGFDATGTGYFVEQATRPEIIGYDLLDSPIALAAWMINYYTVNSHEDLARAFVDKQPPAISPETIVDNITLYWLTGTGASAARFDREEGQENAGAAGQEPHAWSTGLASRRPPGEGCRTPRSWVERAYPNVIYFNEADKGRSFRRLGGTGTLLGKRCAPCSGHGAQRDGSTSQTQRRHERCESSINPSVER